MSGETAVSHANNSVARLVTTSSPFPTIRAGGSWHEVIECLGQAQTDGAVVAKRDIGLDVTGLLDATPVGSAQSVHRVFAPTPGHRTPTITHVEPLIQVWPNPGPCPAGAGTSFYQAVPT